MRRNYALFSRILRKNIIKRIKSSLKLSFNINKYIYLKKRKIIQHYNYHYSLKKTLDALTQTTQAETPNISRKNLSIQTSRYDYLNAAYENNENDGLKTVATAGTIIGTQISHLRQSNDKISKIESLIKSKNLEKSKLIIVNLTPEQLTTNDINNNNDNDNNVVNEFDQRRNLINEKLTIDNENKRTNGLLRDTINQTDFDLLNENDLTRKTTNDQNTPISTSKLKNSFNEITSINNIQQEKYLKNNPSAVNYLHNKMDLNGASYYNQVNSKDNITDETTSQVNCSQAIVYTRDPLDNTRINPEWTQNQTSQRFNSLRRYPLDNDDVVAAAENDDKEFEKNKDLTKIKTSTMNNGNIQKINKYRQHDNLLFDHLERLEEEEDLLKKNNKSSKSNTNNNITETNESGMTFYNGNKYWTMNSQNKIITNANNNINTNTDESNQLVQPTEQPIRMGGLKRIKYEDENEVDVKQPNNALTSAKPPKEAKKVKIKLPIDIENMPKLPPRKERSLQKCCLVFFLLILFVIATGILIYFFGKFFNFYLF